MKKPARDCLRTMLNLVQAVIKNGRKKECTTYNITLRAAFRSPIMCFSLAIPTTRSLMHFAVLHYVSILE